MLNVTTHKKSAICKVTQRTKKTNPENTNLIRLLFFVRFIMMLNACMELRGEFSAFDMQQEVLNFIVSFDTCDL